MKKRGVSFGVCTRRIAIGAECGVTDLPVARYVASLVVVKFLKSFAGTPRAPFSRIPNSKQQT